MSVVPIAPLAALVKLDDQERGAVVKVDVEGYEEPVLRDLRNRRNVALMLLPRGARPEPPRPTPGSGRR